MSQPFKILLFVSVVWLSVTGTFVHAKVNEKSILLKTFKTNVMLLSYQCGDYCYVTYTLKNGKQETSLCGDEKYCEGWGLVDHEGELKLIPQKARLTIEKRNDYVAEAGERMDRQLVTHIHLTY